MKLAYVQKCHDCEDAPVQCILACMATNMFELICVWHWDISASQSVQWHLIWHSDARMHLNYLLTKSLNVVIVENKKGFNFSY